MKIKSLLAKFSPLLESAVVVLLATIFVVSVTYAATTIGVNITTDGNLTASGWASSTSATSTDYVMVGGGAASYTLFDYGSGDIYAQDDLEVDDDANIGGDITVVGGLTVASATTTDSLRVGGYASTTGDLIVGGGTIDLTTTTATTTEGIFSRIPFSGTSTSTVSIGDQEDGVAGCLELVRVDGGTAAPFSCYVNTAGTGIVCSAGRCND